MAEPEFRGRCPTPLAFGTSGLRGLVEDLTDLEAWVCTRGFLAFIHHAHGLRGGPVAVGGDLRPSTPRILRAVQRAIVDAGFEVANLGTLPTPALTGYGMARGYPSVMVTGSHIPFDRNGIKYNRPDGEILKSDEPAILAEIDRVRRAAYAEPRDRSIFDDSGQLRQEALLDHFPLRTEGAQDFLHRYVGFFGLDALRGLEVAVYQHSAAGRDLLVEVLTQLGARVTPVGRSESFVPVDTEAVDEELLATLEDLVAPVRPQGRFFDAIVSTDGDSDRPLLVADGPKGLEFIRGDTLGAMVVEDLELTAIAVPVSASDQIELHLEPRGVHLLRTRIGSPWVIAAFPELPGDRKAGFEANGGFLLASPLERAGSLTALPTRDAFLPLLSVLARVAQGESLLDRVATLPPRATTAGLLDDVDRTRAAEALAELRWPDADELWLEPSAEMLSSSATARSPVPPEDAAAFARAVRARFESLGVGRLLHINAVDGVRLRFEEGDVLHLRPSGNAPQFRLYATANTMDRAQSLVRSGLERGGPVRTLLGID